MKIYLAGPCDSENRTLMTIIAKTIRANSNFEVYCPWELKIENAWNISQEEWAKIVFNTDVEAIKKCDYMIVISNGRISSAGTNWEQGYAMGLNKPVAVIQINNANTSLMTYWGCTLFTQVNLQTPEFNSELQ